MDISDMRDELAEIYGVADVLRVNNDASARGVSTVSGNVVDVDSSLVSQLDNQKTPNKNLAGKNLTDQNLTDRKVGLKEPTNNKSGQQRVGLVANTTPSTSEDIDLSDLSWDSFEKQLMDCKRCKLHTSRKNIVFGEGDRSSELMFLGEGPGASEDEQGRPFVGRSGQLLTDMIKAMGYDRSEVYIANIVKCRPPGNREPLKDEVSACIPFLHMQIELIKPKVIVCLGSTATSHILDLGQKISHLRGKFQEYRGIKVMPTYHPAYLLRNGTKKKDVWNDLQEVMKVLGKKV